MATNIFRSDTNARLLSSCKRIVNWTVWRPKAKKLEEVNSTLKQLYVLIDQRSKEIVGWPPFSGQLV
jgi:hypothetical protein